jgi:cell division protein ZapA (FtsZ GTPase activity inhibitor)
MESRKERVSIRVLDQNYSALVDGDRSRALRAAALVDDRLRQRLARTKKQPDERTLLLLCLELADELLEARERADALGAEIARSETAVEVPAVEQVPIEPQGNLGGTRKKHKHKR